MSRISKIKDVVTSQFGRQVLLGQKHSPKLLFAAGVIGAVGATVVACKATLELDAVMTADEEKRVKAMDLLAGGHPSYSQEKFDADMRTMRVQTAGRVLKLYAPALGIGVVSIACLTGSHVILSKRNAALTAAYATIEKAYADYRKRVADQIGEDREKEIRFGTEEREVVSEGKNGPEVSNIKTAAGASEFARFFSKDTSQSWQPEPSYNFLFLRLQQNHLNDKLRTRGHVFLNDAYDALGLERTKAGSVVGWVKNNPDGSDGVIDFGIFENQDRFYDFVVGKEGSLLLDFNVDGVIWDKI